MRLNKELYAAQNQIVLKLAARETGVSRKEIENAIPCSRPRAEKLVKALGLVPDRKEGRTIFFKTSTSSVPTETGIIDVIPTDVTPTATATAVMTVKKVANPEIAILESRIKKLGGELALATARLTALMMSSN